jgi:hypothetical protein
MSEQDNIQVIQANFEALNERNGAQFCARRPTLLPTCLATLIR